MKKRLFVIFTIILTSLTSLAVPSTHAQVCSFDSDIAAPGVILSGEPDSCSCPAERPTKQFCFCNYTNSFSIVECRNKSKLVAKLCTGGPGLSPDDTCRQTCVQRGDGSGTTFGGAVVTVTPNYNAECDYDPRTKCSTAFNQSSRCTPSTSAPSPAVPGSLGGSVIGPPGTGSGASLPALIGRVVNGALGVMGSIAFLMFVYGGFTWMTAAGNDQRVTRGKNTVIWAVLGLVAIFAAYSIVSFILGGLQG